MAELDDDELLDALGVEVAPLKASSRTPREERIIAGFAEIQRFVEQNKRIPQHGESRDIFAVRSHVLRRAAGKYEFCGAAGFRMADGSIYLETHHLVPLATGGADSVENVFALCPNHHREAHYGSNAEAISHSLCGKFRVHMAGP